MDKEQLWSNPNREKSKHYEVSGADFCKYYQRPPKTHYKTNDVINNPDELNSLHVCPSYNSYAGMFQSKNTQTDYRESETQTVPWDPPYKVHKVFEEPEVLCLKDFYYGNGLPAGILEVEYISKARELNKLKLEAISDESDNQLNKYKQVVWNQVKNDWNYRVAVLNRKKQEKLALMHLNTAEDLKRYSKRREQILKSLWENKKVETYERNSQLEKKLQKELRVLESGSSSRVNDYLQKGTRLKPKKKEDLTPGIDYVLKNYYLSNPSGISTVKKWLETETNSLTCEILPSKNKKVQREKLSEKGYQNIFEKKKTKLPPKVYHEDYEKEETPIPTPKAEAVLEVLDVEEKKVNLVTVWQQVLRGLACQKQMLELIERHTEGLSTILEPLYPGITNS